MRDFGKQGDDRKSSVQQAPAAIPGKATLAEQIPDSSSSFAGAMWEDIDPAEAADHANEAVQRVYAPFSAATSSKTDFEQLPVQHLAGAGNAPGPGKHTLTEQLPVQHRETIGGSRSEATANGASGPGPRSTLQMLFDVQRAAPVASAEDQAQVHAAAARGTATAATKLPYLEQIQQSFGHNDVSGVKAHVGGDAAASAREMGAQAFTTDDHVVFAGTPDLHTVAHEAAHVVQQRRGVHLKGGLGEVGDPYERHADEVADRVVRGESAEELLSRGLAEPTSAVAPAAPATSSAVAPAPRSSAVQRSPGPSAGGASGQGGASPEELRRIINANTTLAKVKPLDAGQQANLEKGMRTSSVYALIKERDKTSENLKKATDELNTWVYNKPPGGAPGPDRDAEKERRSDEVKRLTDEVNVRQKAINALAQSMGTTGDAIVKFVIEEFPKMFVARGKQVAQARLDVNREMVKGEMERYGQQAPAGVDPVAQRAGVRAAAHEIMAKRAEIERIELVRAEVRKRMPDGGAPTAAQLGSSAYDYAHDAENAEKLVALRKQLDQLQARHAMKYRVLYQVDASQLANASDQQLQATVTGKGQELLSNIDKTKQRVENDSIHIWDLKEIVDLTKQDLGVDGNATLNEVVSDHIKRESGSTVAEFLLDASQALIMAAGVIASIATLNPLPAAAAGVVVAGIDAARSIPDAVRKSDANHTDFDTAVGKMSAEDPNWAWVIMSVASVIFSVADLVAAVRALKAAAQTLETFSKTAIRVLGEERARPLVALAKTKLKRGMNIAEQIKAIGAAFKEADHVTVALWITKHGQEGYLAKYLEMMGKGQIRPMTPEAVLEVYGPEVGAKKVKDMLNNPGMKLGGQYDPSKRVAFVKPGTTAHDLAGAAIHELTHALQKATGVAEIMNNMRFYSEYQAHLAQQQYMRRVVNDFGIEAIPEQGPWRQLLNAGPEELRLYIQDTYHCAPHPMFGLNPIEQEDIIKKMLELQMKKNAGPTDDSKLLEIAGRAGGAGEGAAPKPNKGDGE